MHYVSVIGNSFSFDVVLLAIRQFLVFLANKLAGTKFFGVVNAIVGIVASLNKLQECGGGDYVVGTAAVILVQTLLFGLIVGALTVFGLGIGILLLMAVYAALVSALTSLIVDDYIETEC